jgi:hypothetical protein
MGPSVEPAPADNALLREAPSDNGFGSFADAMMPEAMPDPVLPAKPDLDEGSALSESADVFLPPVPEPIEKSPDAWPLNRGADDLIPPAPASPDALNAETIPMSEPAMPMSPSEPMSPAPTEPAAGKTADPWLHPAASGFEPEPVVAPAKAAVPPPASAVPGFDSPFDALSAPADPLSFDTAPAMEAAPSEPPVRSAAAPASSARDFEFELPIPGTKETKDKPKEDAGPQLDLEGTEMKPENLVQIACLFPEGQEKAGQQFVNKLREAAEKLRTPMTLKAVFVSAWSPSAIDPASWAKSAQLSGADSLFVLSFRASAKLFSQLADAVSPSGLKARLIMLEQVGFPTLYADILVELRRTR